MTAREQRPYRLTFARPNGGRFQIGRVALETIGRYVQDAPDKLESGGVILGRHILDTDDVVVDWVTAPLPGDRRARSNFYRAARRHQQAIDRAWQESNGTCTYLGEWHTHPEGCPLPSLPDRTEWERKLRTDQFSEPIFFVIVGTLVMRVWEGRRDGRLTRLQVTEGI